MAKIYDNTTGLQEILNVVNELPEASSGVELPELTNPASTAEVFEGYEVIDADGAKQTGTFTIQSEMDTQASLIQQISAALEGKAGGINTCTITLYGRDLDNGKDILTGYSLTRCVDGAIIAQYIAGSSVNGTTITDVVCGSIITIIATSEMDTCYIQNGADSSSEAPEEAAVLGTSSDMLIAFCKAPTEANSNASFYLHYSG